MCRQDTKAVPTALTGALGSKKHKLQQQMKRALTKPKEQKKQMQCSY